MKAIYLGILALFILCIVYYLFNPRIDSFYYLTFAIYGIERVEEFIKVANEK